MRSNLDKSSYVTRLLESKLGYVNQTNIDREAARYNVMLSV
ncbi:14230_t:CDS:2 [Cetraspora pellucida]|uniref:14230_t:CDS:1 n=1 Tax=Cetraspora pellucida TaxID=1433469 RepID=A0A9N9EXY2_9GLOM|nr:14230_t:CDS:2 [Cetraspora pellucida]